ncbi:MAG: 4'-phosphopantetheinyl transferase superfamily protein [Leptolyngbyaceae cyanobacterium bins.59]|nr:4'-phosphopantetheinyl transferase superfamily protein [Leptolyngbyaceae cyanobacterium bins.59]
MMDLQWHSPPVDLTLSDETVHLWRINLDRPPVSLSELHQTLAPDEQQRADRLRTEVLQQRAIVSRGILRILLGRYLNQPPGNLEFCYGPYGKPAFATVPTPPFHFNLAHSEDLALYAFAQRTIGVDVEKVRSISDVKQLAQRFLAPEEAADVLDTLVDQQSIRFLQYWTCKEAYLKAIGRGLGGLSQVSLSPVTAESVTLMRGIKKNQSEQIWWLRFFYVGPDAIAALAVEGQAPSLVGWGWT